MIFFFLLQCNNIRGRLTVSKFSFIQFPFDFDINVHMSLSNKESCFIRDPFDLAPMLRDVNLRKTRDPVGVFSPYRDIADDPSQPISTHLRAIVDLLLSLSVYIPLTVNHPLKHSATRQPRFLTFTLAPVLLCHVEAIRGFPDATRLPFYWRK